MVPGLPAGSPRTFPENIQTSSTAGFCHKTPNSLEGSYRNSASLSFDDRARQYALQYQIVVAAHGVEEKCQLRTRGHIGRVLGSIGIQTLQVQERETALFKPGTLPFARKARPSPRLVGKQHGEFPEALTLSITRAKYPRRTSIQSAHRRGRHVSRHRSA